MSANSIIQNQVRQVAASLGANIKRCHDALYELRRLTLVLFSGPDISRSQIQEWFHSEGFGIDPDGFWLSLPLVQAFRKGQAPLDAVSLSWHPDLKNNPDAGRRMYSLRGIGVFLQEIHSRLPEAVWIYYQDTTNTSIQFPYIDQATAITPDFDWSAYHTFVSVCPDNNPEREIRWTSPTIDYAGKGLIVSVSIPVYMEERFTGLWSIDVPVNSLHKNIIFDTILPGQVNFILDHNGLLVAHPSIETRIEPDKGSIYQCTIHDLGSEFRELSVKNLLTSGSGNALLTKKNGTKTMVWFESIPGLKWIFMATVPRQSMEDAAGRRIRDALDRVKSGDFSYRIRDMHDLNQARIIEEGFNEMVSALEKQEQIRIQAQKEREKLEKRLHHAQRMEAIGTLAGGIAHDFNNILFPIMGYAELLFHTLDKESRDYLMVEQIYSAAQRARDLIRQILDFSRQTELDNQAVSFQSIVKEALKLLRSSVPRDIEIKTSISNKCQPVTGDPTKLHQIVMNLCTNAFHAVQESGDKFEVGLEPVTIEEENLDSIREIRPGTYVRLTVSDNGHGMDTETMMKIFDPYFSTKEEGKGSGLGLSVTYGIVQKLNGHIKVYSESGKGSTFHVFLPVADKNEEPLSLPNDDTPGGRERILFVDDEVSITTMGKQALERYGYQVTTYNESPAALEAFLKEPEAFDLIITDMTMPKMTGNVLASHIKTVRNDIPIILCTGFSEKISKPDSPGSTVDEFLMKPISIRVLNRNIRNLLDTPARPAIDT